MIKIVETPIDVPQLIRSVIVPEAGGIDIFLGTTRNNSSGRRVVKLEYEAYIPMAERMMSSIEEEVRARWPVCGFTAVHRIGVVAVSEPSIAIVVSAPHRNEAFEACRYAIDEIKRRVPIWKKEVFEEGAVWVGSPPGKPQESVEHERKRH